MQRRTFIKGTVGGTALGMLAGCQSFKSGDRQSLIDKSKVDRAKLAMLCMQRAPWEQGVASQALMALGEKDGVVLMATEAVLRQDKDGRLGIIGGANTVTDPASNGPAVLYAYKATGDKKFKEAADAQYRYLKETAPKAQAPKAQAPKAQAPKAQAPKTAEGTLRHFHNSTQVWSDSMFMAPPFLAYYGDFDESIQQIRGFMTCLWDKDKHMMSHMWDDEQQAFRRKACWGGGNGWSAAGMAVVIDLLPDSKRSERGELITRTRELLDGCLVYLRDDGLFHDVIDDPATFIETNLSQMLAYTIYKGVDSGWLERFYLPYADRMRNAAHTKMDAMGLIQGACGSPRFDRPGTSTEAQAFFIMMEAVYAKLHQT